MGALNNIDDSIILDSAGAYQSLGWAVVPLCGVKHGCPSPGKVPVDLATGRHLNKWQSRGVPTASELEAWLDSPLAARANIGTLTGRVSGIIALDIDGEGGEFLLARYAKGALPPTWEYQTGGGRRLIYAYTEGIRSIKLSGDGDHEGLEILSDGRQMVLPPSAHHSGRSYQWTRGHDPWMGAVDLATCPSWIRDLAGASVKPRDWASIARTPVSHGGRHPTLVQLASHMAAHGESPDFITAMLEAWNDARCKPPKDIMEVQRIVMWALEQHPSSAQATEREPIDQQARAYSKQLGCSLAAARQLVEGRMRA